MHSFKRDNIQLPLSSVWLMNSLSEYKGKQELYTKQSPQVLKALIEIALIESAESSNRIEGIMVERNRLKPLVIGHSKPRDRSEEEVVGYRKALGLIHKPEGSGLASYSQSHDKHKSLRITPETIKELHRLCCGETWDAGKWKEKDNDIIRKYPDGHVEVIFKPVSAAETPEMVKQLCLAYENSITQLKYPDLYAIACLILDFLSIHPFRDGNGRVSRLLTLLALYQHGFLKPSRGAKTAIVMKAIESQHSEFSISDIERACPNVSRVMIKKVLLRQQKDKKIKCLGKGQSAKWERMVY